MTCQWVVRHVPPAIILQPLSSSHDGQFARHSVAMLAGPLHHAPRNYCIANKYPDPVPETGGLAVQLKYPQASLHCDYICCTSRIPPDFALPNDASILAYAALLRLSPVL